MERLLVSHQFHRGCGTDPGGTGNHAGGRPFYSKRLDQPAKGEIQVLLLLFPSSSANRSAQAIPAETTPLFLCLLGLASVPLHTEGDSLETFLVLELKVANLALQVLSNLRQALGRSRDLLCGCVHLLNGR